MKITDFKAKLGKLKRILDWVLNKTKRLSRNSMTTKIESAQMTNKAKPWRRRSKNYSNRTQGSHKKSETLRRTSDFPMHNNPKLSKSWLNTRRGSNKMILRTKVSKERCRIFYKRTNNLEKKSETPKRTWDCLPTRLPNWTVKLMSIRLEFNPTIKSPRLINSRSKNSSARTTHLAMKWK